jgi:hypothetical protein
VRPLPAAPQPGAPPAAGAGEQRPARLTLTAGEWLPEQLLQGEGDGGWGVRSIRRPFLSITVFTFHGICLPPSQ